MLAVYVAAAHIRPVRADIDLHAGIIGDDDRRPVKDNGPPYSAIGQVNIGGYRTRSICTGTLIANRLVLTAAHCVINPATGVPFLNKNIHFVAGVHRDQTRGHSTAACVKFPPNFQYSKQKLQPDLPYQRAALENMKQDLALVVLAEDLPKAPFIATAAGEVISVGLKVSHAAYPADRRYILSKVDSCLVMAKDMELVATDCDTHPGSSGGPLLREREGGLEVIAVLTGLIPRRASLFVPLSNWPDMPHDSQCP